MASSALEALEPRKLFTIDLVCAFVSVDFFDPNTGTLNYSIGVANTGNADTPSYAEGAVFLSSDLVVNNKDDIRLAKIDPKDTPHFGTKVVQGSVQIPTNIDAGNFYLGAALDIDSKVMESEELNNYNFSPNTITIPEQFNINLNGTDGDDKIDIFGGTTNNLVILINGQPFTYPHDRVASIVINGLGGNDRIITADGFTHALYINGGEGNDLISGGDENDTLTGGADQLFGEGNTDRLFGNAGDDMLDGGSSADRLDGGDGRDTVYGQGGDDIFTANDGTADLLFGGSGKDTATADAIDIKSSIVG
jgi:Ca2+-binding RTX toxin-like protein